MTYRCFAITIASAHRGEAKSKNNPGMEMLLTLSEFELLNATRAVGLEAVITGDAAWFFFWDEQPSGLGLQTQIPVAKLVIPLAHFCAVRKKLCQMSAGLLQ